MLIKGKEKNRNKWKMGKVTKLIREKDNVIRGVKLHCAKSTIERPIQLIYPLELECDVGKEQKQRIRNCLNWMRWTSDN